MPALTEEMSEHLHSFLSTASSLGYITTTICLYGEVLASVHEVFLLGQHLPNV